ncbi:MAG: hypothetical protein ACOYNN_01615, partial [Terrimicrobiaceae bacterium]
MNIQTLHIKIPCEPSFTASLADTKVYLSDKGDQLSTIYIWHEGLSNWMRASECLELLGFDATVPPPLSKAILDIDSSPAMPLPITFTPNNTLLSKADILIIGTICAILCLMFMFPPYVEFPAPRPQMTHNLGYAFLLVPPACATADWSVRVDAGRLALQFFAVIAACIVGLACVRVMPKHIADRDSIKQPSHNMVCSVDQSMHFLGGLHHPWRRLFARTVDV